MTTEEFLLWMATESLWKRAEVVQGQLWAQAEMRKSVKYVDLPITYFVPVSIEIEIMTMRVIGPCSLTF